MVTKVKPYINSVEVHPQQSSNKRHPVDGALVGCWFTVELTGSVHVVPTYMELSRVWAVIRKPNGPLRLSERFLRFTVAVRIKKNLNLEGRLSCGYI